MTTSAFLGQAFPFHIRLTASGTVASVGPSLARVMPGLREGGRPEEHFALTRPYAQPLTLASLQALHGEVITLQSTTGLHLQGGVMPHEGSLVLLLVPVVADLATLSRMGLTLRDFPPHDVTGDFLLLLQTTRTSMQALQRVSNDLLKEREHLTAAHADLERSLDEARTARLLLEDSEHRYRTVVDKIREVIFRLDSRGHIVFLNPAWRVATGFDVAASTGRALLDFVHPEDQARARESLTATREGQAPFELRLVTATGQVRDFEVVSGPVPSTEDDIGIVGVLNDVTTRNVALTRLEESHRTMEEAKTLAEEASEAKSNFLAAMSHEIRTPLHALLGMIELLQDTSLTAEQKSLMGTVQSNAEHLRALVTDLLDLAKIEQRGLQLDSEVLDTHAVIESAAELARTRVQPGVTVRCAIAGEVPTLVRGDATRIRQVLFNLTSNAAKFTKAGSITVDATARRRSDEAWELAIAVTDTGIGIPESEQARIFERFHQAGNHRLVGGSGLGLHLSRALLTEMGGTIGFTSVAGQGTRFEVTVPCGVVTDADLPLRNQAHVPSLTASRPAHVLVVEDFPASQQLARDILTRGGHTVEVAATGADAVALAGRTRFDVILMDLQLPDFSGFDAARQIRAAEQQADMPRVPIVAVTAHASEGHAASCRKAGMDDYATKPLAAADLLRLVVRWSDARRAILIIDDSPDAQVISSHALKNLGRRVVTVSSGPEGLAMLDRLPVDLVVVDMHMPEMDGVETTTRIRRRSDTLNLPVLALTGDGTPDGIRQARAAGCDEVLIKPIGRQVLAEVAERLMAPLPPPAPPVAATTDGDDEAISVPEDLADLFPGYVAARRRDLETCQRGLTEQAFDVIKRIAHNIKGTGTSYGLPALTHIGRDLESAAADRNPTDAAALLARMDAVLIRASEVTL